MNTRQLTVLWYAVIAICILLIFPHELFGMRFPDGEKLGMYLAVVFITGSALIFTLREHSTAVAKRLWLTVVMPVCSITLVGMLSTHIYWQIRINSEQKAASLRLGALQEMISKAVSEPFKSQKNLTAIQQAREAGYSDQDIYNSLAKRFPSVQKASSEGFSLCEIENVIKHYPEHGQNANPSAFDPDAFLAGQEPAKFRRLVKILNAEPAKAVPVSKGPNVFD